jgi:hypothetical protein
VIVPIFDGCTALSGSMKDWINMQFPLLLDGMNDGPSGEGKIDVRISCCKWWYYCEDSLPVTAGIPNSSHAPVTGPANPYDSLRGDGGDVDEMIRGGHNGGRNSAEVKMDRVYKAASYRNKTAMGVDHGEAATDYEDDSKEGENDDRILYFYMCPIIKRSNHRKHNSHQWIFHSICEGLKESVSHCFLTDCGTSYDKTCLSKLMYDIFFKSDLIGVTARPRIETPNRFFRPCEQSPFYLSQTRTRRQVLPEMLGKLLPFSLSFTGFRGRSKFSS